MKVTLNDIAKRMGVTSSTVQRALNGTEGVSDAKRAEIQKVAAEMGYKRNYYASSLKRGLQRIAIVLPDSSPHNRYYGHYLWAGIDQYLKEYPTVNLEIVRLTYERSPEDHIVVLEQVLNGVHGDFDGVVTRGSKFRELSDCLQKFEEKTIPVVLAGADSEPRHRLCCVKSCEEMAGRMAADLLLNFGAVGNQSRVIVCGNFTTVNQYNNSLGFERQMWEGNIQPNIMKISSDVDSADTKENIKEILNSGLDVSAIYTCSARSTLAVCEAVKECGPAGGIRIIGSDIFEESVELLRDGTLNAVIHNQPLAIAYQSLQVLDHYLTMEDGNPPDTIDIDSIIVMKSNLGYYTATLIPRDSPPTPEMNRNA